MLSLKPDLTDGTVAILDTDGNPVGVARARASRTIPGYVTLISDTPLGYAIRIPADWAVALEEAATRSMPDPPTGAPLCVCRQPWDACDDCAPRPEGEW